MDFLVTVVTPEMAKEWLSANDLDNRSIREAKVASMARDMREGRWELTHQGIAFNRDGRLVDGQHRLHAIVKAGLSIRMLVVRNSTLSYASKIDVGSVRSAKDILKQSNQLIAAARVLRSLSSGTTGGSAQYTVGEVEETLEQHREALTAIDAAYIRRQGVGHRVKGRLAGALAYAQPLDPDRVKAFCTSILTGELLEHDDPAYALRSRMSSETARSCSDMDIAFIGCSCIAYELRNDKLSKVVGGPTGYRWLTTRRRVLGIPNTPPVESVASNGGAEPADVRRSRIAQRRLNLCEARAANK